MMKSIQLIILTLIQKLLKIKNKQEILINDSYRDFINVNEVSRFLNFSSKKDLKGILNLDSGKSLILQKDNKDDFK